MHSLAAVYLLVFGVLTILGGVIGFVRAKSIASLLAGGIAGGLLLFAGALCLNVGVSPKPGLVLGLVVSAALAARFVMSFRKSRKVMPAGLMAVLGLIGIGMTALALAE